MPPNQIHPLVDNMAKKNRNRFPIAVLLTDKDLTEVKRMVTLYNPKRGAHPKTGGWGGPKSAQRAPTAREGEPPRAHCGSFNHRAL